MALRLVTPPASEPLTLAEAKDHLRVTHNAEDNLLAAYVSAARQACEGYQRRSYITQTWELALDAFPSAHAGEIELPRPPIQSVTSIKYIDTDGAEITMATADYQVDVDSEPGRLFPAYGTRWPATRVVPNAVRIRYVAGYAPTGAPSVVDPAGNVPEPVKQAMRFYLGHYNANREGVVTGTIATPLPFAARAHLGPGRVYSRRRGL